MVWESVYISFASPKEKLLSRLIDSERVLREKNCHSLSYILYVFLIYENLAKSTRFLNEFAHFLQLAWILR